MNMHQRGVIRHLDTLGRVVIPKEFRNHHDIANGDSVEIFNTSEGILIKKYDSVPDVVQKLRDVDQMLRENHATDEIREQVQIHVAEIMGLLDQN